MIATALPDGEAYGRNLSVTETTDYRHDDVAAAIRARYPDGTKGLVDLIPFPVASRLW